MNSKQVSMSIVVASAIMGSVTALLAVAAAYFSFYQTDMLSGQTVAIQQRHSTPDQSRELTAQEEIQQVIAWRTTQIVKFNAEPIAPDWSKYAESTLLAQFDEINQERGQHSLEPFIVDNLECRFSMCVATLRWDNIELARDASPTIAGYSYHLPCATSSLVYDDPQQIENDNYRSEVIFRCKREQSQQKLAFLSGT